MWRLRVDGARARQPARRPVRRQHLLSRAADADLLRRDGRRGAGRRAALRAGLPPVLVHNLLLLGAIVASAAGMFVLARHLTGAAGRRHRRRDRSSRSCLIASSTTCTWSCSGPCGCRGRSGRCTGRSRRGSWRYGAADRAVRVAADAVEHLLRRLPDRAARRRDGAAPAVAAASRAAGADQCALAPAALVVARVVRRLRACRTSRRRRDVGGRSARARS